MFGDLDVKAGIFIVRVLLAFFWSSFDLLSKKYCNCFDELTLVDFQSVVM